MEFPRKPSDRVHLLTLRDVMRRFGLSQRVVYQNLTAFGHGDEGRTYYSEQEAAALKINRRWLVEAA